MIFHYACFKFLSVFYEPHLIPEAAEALFEDKRVTESGFDFIQKTEVGIGQKGVRGYKSFRPREPRSRGGSKTFVVTVFDSVRTVEKTHTAPFHSYCKVDVLIPEKTEIRFRERRTYFVHQVGI